MLYIRCWINVNHKLFEAEYFQVNSSKIIRRNYNYILSSSKLFFYIVIIHKRLYSLSFLKKILEMEKILKSKLKGSTDKSWLWKKWFPPEYLSTFSPDCINNLLSIPNFKNLFTDKSDSDSEGQWPQKLKVSRDVN